MRSCRILIISTAVAFGPMSAYGSTECRSIEGVESLLAPGKVVLLGEIHGTAECPAFTEALACHAARAGLEVVVGLELLAGATEEFERYLASEGKPADRTALLAGSLWQQSYQDGRTSRAMADLLEGLGRIRRAGHSVRVTLFDAQPGDSQARERAMARNLASSVFASPEALHVVLTGNRHSRITPGNGRSIDYEPMGHLLSRAIGAERLISLAASYTGGSAWICAPDCGVAKLGGQGAAGPWRIDIDEVDRPAGHHGRFTVGVIQASLPAVGDPAAYASIPETAPAAPVPAPADSAAAAFPAQTPELLQPFQGVWDAYQYDSRAWTIEIEDGRFRGVLGPDDWYEGTIRVRRDTDPMQIDFDIEDCRCSYRGMTSQAIFRVTGETILLAAPQPGLARPTVFSEHDGRTVELRRTKTTRPGDTPRGSTAGGVGSTEESRTRTR